MSLKSRQEKHLQQEKRRARVVKADQILEGMVAGNDPKVIVGDLEKKSRQGMRSQMVAMGAFTESPIVESVRPGSEFEDINEVDVVVNLTPEVGSHRVEVQVKSTSEGRDLYLQKKAAQFGLNDLNAVRSRLAQNNKMVVVAGHKGNIEKNKKAVREQLDKWVNLKNKSL